ncbi:MAG: hypothetical protein KGI37_06395 [Alphaproteobacteria bacterium]|nr:hypothetical protein [Alphaproteobacteria bacterium]
MSKRNKNRKQYRPTPASILETLLTMFTDEQLLEAEERFRGCIKDDPKGWHPQDRELIAIAFDNQAQYRGEAWRR